MKRLSRLALAAAAVALVVPLSACSALINAQQTANYMYNGGDGSWATVGGVEVRGLMLVTSKEGEGDAQLFYTLVNNSEETQRVTIEVGGTSVQQSVDAGDVFQQNPNNPTNQDAEPEVVSGLDAKAGDLVDVTVKVGDKEDVIRTQVLSDAIPDYADAVPTAPAEEPTDDATDGATDGATDDPTATEDPTAEPTTTP